LSVAVFVLKPVSSCLTVNGSLCYFWNTGKEFVELDAATLLHWI